MVYVADERAPISAGRDKAAENVDIIVQRSVQRQLNIQQFWKAWHFLKQIFKSLVQPHIDYCSQLWMPLEGVNMDKIEKVLRDFSKRVPGLRDLGYWERLKTMGMNSEQRRLERYKIIYVWKVMEGIVPNCGLKWANSFCLVPF